MVYIFNCIFRDLGHTKRYSHHYGRILTSLEISIPNQQSTGAVANDLAINYTICVRRIIRYIFQIHGRLDLRIASLGGDGGGGGGGGGGGIDTIYSIYSQ